MWRAKPPPKMVGGQNLQFRSFLRLCLNTLFPAELFRVAVTVQYGPQWDNHPNDFNISKKINSRLLLISGRNVIEEKKSFVIRK